VIWAGAAPGGQGLAPIVSGADRPLIASLPTPLGRVFWLNVDLGRSNLARSPDWPILLHNLVGLRRRALPGLDKRTFRLGDDIQCQRPDPEAAVTVSGPGGFRKTLAPSADIYLSRLTEPGIYQLEAGGQAIDRFALNLLDDKESDLAGLSTGRADAGRAAARTQLVRGQRPGWLGFVLGGLALAALLGNWRLNYRRADDA